MKAMMDTDLCQPGWLICHLCQRGPATPSGKHRFLDDILGLGRIVENCKGDPIEARDLWAY